MCIQNALPFETSGLLRSIWVSPLCAPSSPCSLSRPASFRRADSYDIVVYGGTSGGVTAAIQAARLGKTVVLIEPTKFLGGLTTGGLGATDIGNKKAIGGMSREFYQRIFKHYADPAKWDRADARRVFQSQAPRQ